MTIYLDIVLLENVLMNYIIIFSTAIISKSKINHKRIFLASLISGIYSILNYIWSIGSIENIVIKILISILIVLLGFESKKLKTIVKQLILFYVVSFIFGGISFMLLFLINPADVVFKNGLLVGTYPIKVLIGSGIFGIIIVICVSYIIKDRMRIKSMLCDLEIVYNKNVKKVKTMIDTGNLLKDPITGTDVIIVEKESLKEIFPTDILENIDNIITGKWIGSSEKLYRSKIKLIPFSSLGNENGLLIGFKPDYIRIINENEYFQKDVIIGIYNGKLSKSNLYSSLIGLDIFNKGKIAEMQ